MIGLEYIFQLVNSNANQLSQNLEISRYTIYDWIKKRRKIPDARIKQLSEYFQIPEEYFQKELLKSEKSVLARIFFDRISQLETEEYDYSYDYSHQKVIDMDKEYDNFRVNTSLPEEGTLDDLYIESELIEKVVENIKVVLDMEWEQRKNNYQGIFRDVLSVIETGDVKKVKKLEELLQKLKEK